MELSNDISVLALVISLIALVVALGQLSQQVLSTADGYRRCAESVIGPWAHLRRRKWIWSEFRFEVKFSTPHLMVRAADEDTVKESFADTELCLYLSELQSYQTKSRRTRRAKVLRVLGQSLSGIIAQQPLKSYSNLEKHLIRQDTRELLFGPGKPHGLQNVEARSEVLASWVLLLRALYRSSLPLQNERHAANRTEFAVGIREWTWDFMPFDTQRPLATSTLHHIILLAARLNMRWRMLGPDYQAGGNGYSLTSFEIRGLPGVAFQFSVEPNTRLQRVNWECAPSAAVDKLYFGILPGCAALVRQDIATVDDNRSVDFGPMIHALGVREHSDWLGTYMTERDDSVVLPCNDAIILLCDFLPVADSAASRHLSPFWPGFSVLHFWEGRSSLLRCLRKRASEVQGRAGAAMQRTLAELQHVQDQYHYDFFDKWPHSVIENGLAAERRKFLNDLRRIFELTTAYFCGMHPELSTFDWGKVGPGNERPHYVDLVAAHMIMAHSAVPRGWQAAKEFNKRIDDVSQRKRELGNAEALGMVTHYYFYAEEYASCARDVGDDNIVDFLRSKRLELDVDDIEAAWWMLMLRGIIWDMSTVGDVPFGDKFRQLEENIPSSLYYSQIPVWIN